MLLMRLMLCALLSTSAAFADAGFVAPQEYVGTYRIASIRLVDGAYAADACIPHKDKRGHARVADPRCGMVLDLIHSGPRITFLDSRVSWRKETRLALLTGQCKAGMPWQQARTGLLAEDSKFCRATLKPSDGTPGVDAYFFNSTLDPNGPVASKRAARGATHTDNPAVVVPIVGGWSASDLTIRVSRTPDFQAPGKITIQEDVATFIHLAFFPFLREWKQVITLERVVD